VTATDTNPPGPPAGADDTDLTAADVAWDLDTLLDGRTVDELLDDAGGLVEEVVAYRGRVAELDAGELAHVMELMARLQTTIGRAGNYASLWFSVDTADPARGALMAKVQERATTLAAQLLFFELEWVAVPDEAADRLLADPALGFAAHHLRTARRYRDHVLTEPEERVLTETSVAATPAWVRLFDELTSAIRVALPVGLGDPGAGTSGAGQAGSGDAAAADPETDEVGLEHGLALLQHPDREVRRTAAEAVTAGLAPGLRTRAYVFNTLLLDKSVDDRLRHYPSWISARNLANEASDASVQALVDAVVARYDLPQRWYRLKAQVLGLERIADFDRMASVAADTSRIGWTEARTIVLDAYRSFSPELADAALPFFDDRWIDAPARPGKRPGAFCAYTVPDHHPYLLLNWTGQARDVATLAHELGHGLHAWLARGQGVFHQSTPLTLAETASVFGETVTNNALLAQLDDADARFALLASTLEDSIATVFRQVAMNRFEAAVHAHRRDVGELSVDDFSEHWAATQHEMLGDAVELTEGYATWWSYIPHFIGTPGYVYAYAYGQLLALSVYARYEADGAAFVPDYLRLLSAGGSMPPAELGRIVGVDLDDPSFWDGGLDIVAAQLDRAVAAAHEAGRLDGD
jgi:oligoendopeptidase F